METTRKRQRGIGGWGLRILTLVCVLATGMSDAVAAQAGPTFDMVTLSASRVPRGDTVMIFAHVTDSTADVLEAPTISFFLPDGADGPAIDFALTSGDARDGRYTAALTISPLLPPGQYAVKLLRAYDGDGSIVAVTPPDPRLAALTLTVTDGDMGSATGAPSASAAASTTVTLAATPTSGATATATPMALSTVTGTRVLPATVSQPTPAAMFGPIPTGGPGPDIAATSMPIPTIAVGVTVLPAATRATTTATIAPTTATPTPHRTTTPVAVTAIVSTATATPRARATAMPVSPARRTGTTGATPTRAASVTAATAQRTVAATAATTGTGPALVSLALSDTAVLPGDAVVVTAHITDSAADVADFPTLRYRLPDGSDGPFAYLRRISGAARDGMYQAVVGLSPFFPPGTYTIAAVTMRDRNGNTTTFTAPPPAQPDATFIVQPFMPPTPTPAPPDAG